jgi:methyl-accepting chemotaxis protein
MQQYDYNDEDHMYFREKVERIIDIINEMVMKTSISSSDDDLERSLLMFRNCIAFSKRNAQLLYAHPKNNRLFLIDCEIIDETPSPEVAINKNAVCEIECIPPLPTDFRVYRIHFNPVRDMLALQGERSVHVIKSLLKGTTKANDTNSFPKRAYANFDIRVGIKEDILTMEPSPRVLKIGWHPLSVFHLTILTSENYLRIYNLSNNYPNLEQEFYLLPEQKPSSNTSTLSSISRIHSQQKLGVFDLCIPEEYDYSSEDINNERQQDKERVVSFMHGEDRLWERFTIFYLTDKGNIYALAPVVPFKCYIAEEFFVELYNVTELNSNYVHRFIDSVTDFICTARENELDNGAISKSDLPSQADEDEGCSRVIYTKPHDHNLFTLNTKKTLEPIGPFQICTTPNNKEETEWTDLIILRGPISLIPTFICVNAQGQLRSLVLLDNIYPSISATLDWEDITERTFELVAYDTVDLSLNNLQKNNKPYLVPHAALSYSVYCVHAAGVHQVDFPFLSDIDQYYQVLVQSQEQQDIKRQKIRLNSSSAVNLFCALEARKLCAPIGIASSNNPTIGLYLFFLDSSLHFSVRNILSFAIEIQPFSQKTQIQGNIAREPLMNIIKKINDGLNKPIPTYSVIKEKDHFPLTQIFQEIIQGITYQYIPTIFAMNDAIVDRINKIKEIMRSQGEAYSKLQHEVEEIKKNNKKIEEKISEIQDKQGELAKKKQELQKKGKRIQLISKSEQEFNSFIEKKLQKIEDLKEKVKEIEQSKNDLYERPLQGTFSEERTKKIITFLQSTERLLEKTKDKLKNMEALLEMKK